MEQNWCVPGKMPTRFPVTNVPLSQLEQGWIYRHTHRFQAACGRHGLSNERADRDRNTHLSLSSETPKINAHGHEAVAKTLKREIIPQDYHHRLFAVFLSETQRSRATLPQYWPQHQWVRASRDCWLWWPSSTQAEKPSNRDSPPPSIWSQWTPSWSTGPESQKH